jgi:hypothetical protein
MSTWVEAPTPPYTALGAHTLARPLLRAAMSESEEVT